MNFAVPDELYIRLARDGPVEVPEAESKLGCAPCFVVRSVPARVPLIVFRILSTLVCLRDPLSGQCLCGTCILRLVQPVEALAGGVQTWMARP